MNEELGDAAGIATMLGDIGVIHCSNGNNSQAPTSHERVLKTQKELRDRAGVARTLGSLGNIYTLFGNHSASATNTVDRT